MGIKQGIFAGVIIIIIIILGLFFQGDLTGQAIEQPFCIGANDPYIKETVHIISGAEYEDRCINRNLLREYTCKNNQIEAELIECRCNNGECI